jgi:glutathione-specific gamma-glutamylcyclotransferase
MRSGRLGHRVPALTPELVARCGPAVTQPQRTRFTPAVDGDYEEALERHLALLDGVPLRVFAYGSLIWNPGCAVAERLPGTALGWRRSFGIRVERARGSPERPGYMLTLAPGGRCRGVVLEVAEGDRRAALEALIRREYPAREFLGQTRRVKISTPHGVVQALAFWAGRFAPLDALGHPVERIAYDLAHARGSLGSGAEYLYRTMVGLAEHGIHDPYLWRVQQLVADEIRAWAPPAG